MTDTQHAITEPRAPAKQTRREIMQRITKDVAREHNVPVVDIMSRSRFPEHWEARKEAIRRIKFENPKITTTDIGHFFGRHHASVLNALGRLGRNRRILDNRYTISPDNMLFQRVDEISSMFSAGSDSVEIAKALRLKESDVIRVMHAEKNMRVVADATEQCRSKG